MVHRPVRGPGLQRRVGDAGSDADPANGDTDGNADGNADQNADQDRHGDEDRDTDQDRAYTTAMCVLSLEVYYRYFTPLVKPK